STRDARLGHVMVAGVGGVLVELLKDVALRLPPLSPAEAHAMVMETRTAKLLSGYRGRPVADQASLARALPAFSTLVADLGEAIEEREITPLFALDDRTGARVGGARIPLRAPDAS